MKFIHTTSTYKNGVLEYKKGETLFTADSGIEKEVINLYPQVKGQTFEGFGGALTDSAGYVYSQMSKEQQEKMIDIYFGEHENALKYRMGRIHIDSCDFSVEQYEAMSDKNDREMKSFSLERTQKYILPLLKDVQNYIGKPLDLMITPWSPPAFMKTNQERSRGGKLLNEYKLFWAEYICRYIKELTKVGCDIKCLSIQNEPKAVQTWDSCIYTIEEEKEFLRDFLYPTLKKENLADLDIYIWDHNKERLFERACGIIDDETDFMVAGLAFHWYSGDHFEAVKLVHDMFPNKKLIMSEACIEYSLADSCDSLLNAQKYAHDIIGNMNNGMTAFYDWNLLLDEKGGPNHVGNYCDAPFMFDTNKKVLEEKNTLRYLWHFSQFIEAGAKLIGFSRYTDSLDVTALENPDGNYICVILNRDTENKNVTLRVSGEEVNIDISGNSIMTGNVIK